MIEMRSIAGAHHSVSVGFSFGCPLQLLLARIHKFTACSWRTIYIHDIVDESWVEQLA